MRKEFLLNKGWKFKEGESILPPIMGHFETYMHSKAQKGRGEATQGYYDQEWEDIIIPHDFVLNGNPSSDFNESQGSLERKNGWYRRNIKLEEEYIDKRVILLFDGAGMQSDVYVNGHLASSNYSMYNSFHMDITPYITYGDKLNTIAVHIDNKDLEGWWYEGGGIYRNVHLIITDKIAIDVYGTYVNPECNNKNDIWALPIETTISNLEEETKVIIKNSVFDENEINVASIEEDQILSNGVDTHKSKLVIKNPNKWSLDSPTLYSLRTKICKTDGKVLDEYTTKFGFRSINFDGIKGFFLNGEHVKLRGVCMHQDHGNLGVAVPKSVLEFRIRKLKEAGVNAYRCAHNNPDPELFEICDRLGLLVLDENRWFNCSTETLEQVKSMVLRDRNHPSLIVWSIGNEEPLQNTPIGGKITKSLLNYIRRFDKSRPITVALNADNFDVESGRESDILGVNYMLNKYPALKSSKMHKPVIATESGASENNRGVYFSTTNEKTEYKNWYATAYDLKRAPFGSPYLTAIKESETNDFISGTFLWSGFEYRGEAHFPKLFSGCGFVDSAGIAKDNFYLVQALWTKEPMVHILPHFDLFGHEGEAIDFITYSNCEEVELIVNDKSLGKQKVKKFEFPKWNLIYNKGNIKAIGYNNNQVVTEQCINTSREPKEFTIKECNTPTNSGLDTAIFELGMKDCDGNKCYTANNRIEVSKIAGGRILALSNGDPLDGENARNAHRRLFNGSMQLIFGIDKGVEELSFTLADKNNGFKKDYKFKVNYSDPPLEVATCNSSLEIKGFRKWPNAKNKKAIDLNYNFSDMNSSIPIELSNIVNENNSDFTVLTSSTITPNYPEDKQLFIKISKSNILGTIKIFHEKNCWPNPEPKEFLTFKQDLSSNKNEDLFIDLKGVACNEQLNIVMIIDNKVQFDIKNISYVIK
jgi:beta-galactosidase